MIRLIVHLARLFVANGFWGDVEKTLRTVSFLLVNFCLVLVMCSRLPEGWNFIDSFYFCVLTMATVLYGGVAPILTLAKLLTVLISLLAVGAVVLLTGKLAEFFLDRKCS